MTAIVERLARLVNITPPLSVRHSDSHVDVCVSVCVSVPVSVCVCVCGSDVVKFILVRLYCDDTDDLGFRAR